MHHTNPDVKMTDNERFAISWNTTAGFKHHKLNVCVQSPKCPDTMSQHILYQAAAHSLIMNDSTTKRNINPIDIIGLVKLSSSSYASSIIISLIIDEFKKVKQKTTCVRYGSCTNYITDFNYNELMTSWTENILNGKDWADVPK